MTPLQKARIQEMCKPMSSKKLDGIRQLILILKDTPKIPEPEAIYRQEFCQKAGCIQESDQSGHLGHQKVNQ